jgi:hypothetical protein
VFHGHIREGAGQQVGEDAVELVRVPTLAFPLSDQDPPDGRVARPRNAEPCGDRPQEAPCLGVGEPDRAKDAEREDELRVYRRMKRHETRVAPESSCV